MASSGNPILDEIKGNRLRPTKTVDKSKPAFLRAEDEKKKTTTKGFKKSKSAQPTDENTAPPPPPPAVAPPPAPLLAVPDSGLKRASSNPALAKLGGKESVAIDRDQFLNSIKGGVKLRKAETKDKSGLIVDEDMASTSMAKTKKAAPCVAPPPPPLMAPPPPGAPKVPSGNAKLGKLGGKAPAEVDLGEFLNSIRGGIKLRKAVTNDKSGLIVDDTMLEGGMFQKKEEGTSAAPAPPPPPPPCLAPPPPPMPSGEMREKKESDNKALKKLGGKTAKDVDMGELLNNIKGGIKLRKTETKDKSGLIVDETMLQGGLFQKKEDGVVPEIDISSAPPPPPPPMAAPPPPPPAPSEVPKPPRVKKEVTNSALKKLGGKTASEVDMGEFLNNIKGGIRLRKTETKDRSGLIVDDTMTSGRPLVRVDEEKLRAARPKTPPPQEEISEEDAAALLAEMDEPVKKVEKKKPEPPPEPKKSDFAFDEKNLHVTKEDLQKEIPTGKASGMRAMWDQQISKSPSPAPVPMQSKNTSSYLKKDGPKETIAPRPMVKARTPDPQPVTKKPEAKKSTDVAKEIKRLRNAKLKKQEQSEDVPDLSEADAAALLEELDNESREVERLVVPERGQRAQSTPVAPEDDRCGFDEKSLVVTREDLEKEIPVGKAAGMRALFDQSSNTPSFFNNPTVIPAPRIKLSDMFIRKDSEDKEKEKEKKPEPKKAMAPVQRKKKPLKKQDSDFEMPELSEADAAALLEELENSDEEEDKSTADACYDEKSLHITKEDIQKEIPSGKAKGMRAMFDAPSTSSTNSLITEQLQKPRGRMLRESFVCEDVSDSEIPQSDADLVCDIGKITHDEIKEEIPSGVAASKIAMWAGRESVVRESTPKRSVGRLDTSEASPFKVENPSIQVNGERKISKWAPVQTSGLARTLDASDRSRGGSMLRETTPLRESERASSAAPTTKAEVKKVEKVEKKDEKKTKTAETPKKKEEKSIPVGETADKPKRTVKKKKSDATPPAPMSFAVEPKKSVLEKVAAATPKATVEPVKKVEEEKKSTVAKKSTSAAPKPSEIKASLKTVEKVEEPKRKVSEVGKKKMEQMERKKSSDKKSTEERPKLSRKDSKRKSLKGRDAEKKSVTEKPIAKVAPAPARTEDVKSKRTNPTVEKAKEVSKEVSGSAEPILRPTPRPFFLNKRQDSTTKEPAAAATTTRATFTVRSGFKK